jgi:hypothetical protein
MFIEDKDMMESSGKAPKTALYIFPTAIDSSRQWEYNYAEVGQVLKETGMGGRTLECLHTYRN